ncbi:P22AR C-terminal domain-containing protein [Serratia microhaemolytica]|uniref:P22AR C-terminal domain-containing protein n=1 Tax=Serratia microhaemolytica TaxID=2675110 RepID=UPI0013923497|nr:P22AR C-terminal domain-containing protein [Serratia microhaemolytica]
MVSEKIQVINENVNGESHLRVECERQMRNYHAAKVHTITLTDEELCNLCWLWNAAEYMRQQIAAAHPALELLQSKLAGSYWSMGFEYQHTLDKTKQILARETQAITPHPDDDSDANWRSVLTRLRG